MAFNINEFTGKINNIGLAKSNLFEMDLTVPENIRSQTSDLGLDDFKFLCKSVQIPELSIETSDYRPSGFGIAYKKASNFQYAPLTAVFMVDANFRVLKFFNKWIQNIVNFDLSNGMSGISANGLEANHFAYKVEYVGAATINMYSVNSTDPKHQYVYRFLNLYPTSVGALQPSWENNAEVMTANISFAYDYMEIDGTTTSFAE